jgi:hypothetical protein
MPFEAGRLKDIPDGVPAGAGVDDATSAGPDVKTARQTFLAVLLRVLAAWTT